MAIRLELQSISENGAARRIYWQRVRVRVIIGGVTR
jgi:hypothetical protein